MEFSEAIVLALIALVSTTIGIIWKMYNTHSKLAESVLEVVKENTVATQQQVASTNKQIDVSQQIVKGLGENTHAIKDQAKVLADHKEVLSGLALRALSPNIRKTDKHVRVVKKRKTKKTKS